MADTTHSRRFFSFEGIDGSGKSTQARLLAESLRRRGHTVVEVREPGTTPLGENVRRLLLTPGGVVSPRAELFLFLTARAQLVDQIVRPALDSGAVVVADRFVDSSVVYQGAGRSAGSVEQIESLSAFASDGLVPARTYWIDVDLKTAQARRGASDPDRIEQSSDGFYQRLQEAYSALLDRHPARIARFDGSVSANDLHLLVQEDAERVLTS